MQSLQHVLWPVCCPVCGKLGEAVCPSCLGELAGSPVAVCLECGAGEPCAVHPAGPYCRGVSRYDAWNRRVIHAMKYRGSRRVAVMMGERIARTLAAPDADCLVPVPLHKDSSRDYNQARLIAAGAGRVWGIPVISALAWSRNVPGQARKRGAEERFLPDGVIIVSKDVTPYRRICLIDDVHTTGNTLRAAASALERAGRSVTAAMVWSVS